MGEALHCDGLRVGEEEAARFSLIVSVASRSHNRKFLWLNEIESKPCAQEGIGIGHSIIPYVSTMYVDFSTT
jgi:hypothetical protein